MTFSDLSEEQKNFAVNYFVHRLIIDLIEGGLRFNDDLNGDDFQARIDRAIQKAEKNQTPWFAGEILLEDKVCRETIEGMARCNAEDSTYERNARGEVCVVFSRLEVLI